MKYQKLSKGQAIVIVPDELHCYLSGQCIECMVNSDNVVRCGLTPKFKDNATLLNMMSYEMVTRGAYEGAIIEQRKDVQVVEYKSGYSEFRVLKICIEPGCETYNMKLPCFCICILLGGHGEVDVEGQGRYDLQKYESHYILPERKLTFSSSNGETLVLYVATCDL